jgi:hypothetical protein
MKMSDTETEKPEATTDRAEAGLVEEDFEVKPNDDAIAAGEYLVENATQLSTPPSQLKIAGMSEEEQNMEMTPTVVGPPAYGSPVPETSAGRLLPIDQHPFNPANLPDDHPAAIAEDYGEGYQANLTPAEVGTSFPGAPQQTDLQQDLQGDGSEGGGGEAPNYDALSKGDVLAEAEGRGLDVTASNTKQEIVDALKADDAAKASSGNAAP